MLRLRLKEGAGKRWGWLPVILLESALLVASILLAFSVENWRERREEEELVTSALRNIQGEIQTNLAEAERQLVFHEQFLDSLNQRLQNGLEAGTAAAEVFGALAPQEGFEVFYPVQSSYKTALAAGAIRHMDFSTANLLAKLYSEESNGIVVATRRVQDGLFTYEIMDPSANRQMLTLLSLYMMDIVFQERNLVERYREVLDSLAAWHPERLAN